MSLLLIPINIFFNDIMVWLFKTFMPRYLKSNYISRVYKLEVPYLTMILVTVAVVLLLVSQTEQYHGGMERIFLNACMISAVLATVCTWLPEYKRFVYYFFVSSIVVIPKLLEKQKKKWVKVTILALVVIADWINLSTIIGFTNVLPYKSIFRGD